MLTRDYTTSMLQKSYTALLSLRNHDAPFRGFRLAIPCYILVLALAKKNDTHCIIRVVNAFSKCF